MEPTSIADDLASVIYIKIYKYYAMTEVQKQDLQTIFFKLWETLVPLSVCGCHPPCSLLAGENKTYDASDQRQLYQLQLQVRYIVADGLESESYHPIRRKIAEVLETSTRMLPALLFDMRASDLQLLKHLHYKVIDHLHEKKGWENHFLGCCYERLEFEANLCLPDSCDCTFIKVSTNTLQTLCRQMKEIYFS